ncbi:hypothetical protein J14TS5_43940 [Paenibacillus lautus]|uniref:hypothetical protein n=1 Tax=Paenibacillus lautus TaxID=1401 RepID=UPI001B2980B5|nr:hypothetical protein [Paenibacillus lautus]GIO99308.1 hypothetical protein J14TS5_43940 [Paenibacillus lautus]
MKRGFLAMIVLSLTVGLWLGAEHSTVSALKCTEPRKLTEELKTSDAVFKGTLTSSNPKADISKSKYVFQVSEWWKGDSVSPTVTLYSNGWEFFETGKEYIVFADKSGQKLKPHLCGNTGPSSSVDVTSLGEGIQPEKPVRSVENSKFGGILASLIELIRWLLGKY